MRASRPTGIGWSNYDAMRPPIDRAFRTETNAEWVGAC